VAGSPRFGHAAAVSAGAAVVLVGTAIAAQSHPPLPGEAALFERVNGLGDWLEPPLVVVMQLGLLSVALIAAVVIGAVARSARVASASAAAALAAWLLANQAKEWFSRGRPAAPAVDLVARDQVSGYGYPSTHTAVAVALATVVVALVPGRWRWVAVVSATLVGVARVYVGVHYPLDVLGGAALGVVVGTAATSLLRYVGGGPDRATAVRRPTRA
jgi:undecaprenyl-diphosphatase